MKCTRPELGNIREFLENPVLSRDNSPVIVGQDWGDGRQVTWLLGLRADYCQEADQASLMSTTLATHLNNLGGWGVCNWRRSCLGWLTPGIVDALSASLFSQLTQAPGGIGSAPLGGAGSADEGPAPHPPLQPLPCHLPPPGCGRGGDGSSRP